MRSRTFATVAGLVALCSMAAAQTVSFDFDKATDFSTFKKYAWVRGTPLTDQLNHTRVVSAIDSQLGLKGLSKVEASANPDLLVAYHASFDKDIQITGFSSGFGPYRFGGTRSGSASVDEILVGTIAVDIVNAATKSIVWRGTASKEVDVKASPDKREKNINRAAEKLFKSYPPQN